MVRTAVHLQFPNFIYLAFLTNSQVGQNHYILFHRSHLAPSIQSIQALLVLALALFSRDTHI